MATDISQVPTLEIAHVLFLDIVSFSTRPMDDQRQALHCLQHAIQSTSDYSRFHAKEQLISLPTGDGAALVFFGDAEAPARCALELAVALKSAQLPVRMGINSGPVYRIADINANRNVAGGGINLAQRVMDLCDAGHILVSGAVADVLGQLKNWSMLLHDLGEAEVKHGVRVHVFNLYNDTAGRADAPTKITSSRGRRKRASAMQRKVVPALRPSAFDPGTEFLHYRIVGKLGSGGMGVVYEAEDTRLGRSVALKFVSENFTGDRETLHRFEREARLASALNHPNICTVYDLGVYEGEPFLVTELLEGQTLNELVTSTPADPNDVVRWGTQVADALDAAHAKGIVHRDIKPANILITPRGNAKVLDFGLAKLMPRRAVALGKAVGATDEHLTSPGTPLGTIAYMSPEQARAEEVDARTDIFSLGTVLYELVTARRAFEGNSPAVIFDGILNRTPTAITEINPAAPAALVEIIDRAMAKGVATRYQTAAEMRAELEALNSVASLGNDGAWVRLAPWRRPAAGSFSTVIGAEARNTVKMWLSVITRGAEALKGLDFENDSIMLFGLRFLLYMTLLELITYLPFSGDRLPLIGWAAETYVEYLGLGLILQLCMGFLGGKAKAQSGVTGYCFLTAYLPLSTLCMVPLHRMWLAAETQKSNYPEKVLEIFGQLQQLSSWDRSILVLSFLAATGFLVLFYVGVFRFMRALHRLGRLRALVALALGLVGSAVFALVVLDYLISAILQSTLARKLTADTPLRLQGLLGLLRPRL